MPTQDILVPLDGSTLAEGALMEAAQLAQALHAGVTFLRVIPPVDDVIQSGCIRVWINSGGMNYRINLPRRTFAPLAPADKTSFDGRTIRRRP